MKGKRILSVLLTLVLMLNIALAVEGKAEAKETDGIEANLVSGISQTVDTDKTELAGVPQKERTTSYDNINATTMLTSATAAPEYTRIQFESGTYYILAITAQNTGYMYFDYIVEGEATSSYVTMEVTNKENADIFSNSNGADSYASFGNTQGEYTVGSSAENMGPIYVTKGETYYAIIVNWESDASVIGGIRAKLYTTGTRTLTQGTAKWTLASGLNKSGDGYSTAYFKVTPDRTGVMTVSLMEYGYHNSYGSSGTVTLLNSNQKALSNAVTYNSKVSGSRVYFGVKKGVTYYLKVTNCCGTAEYNYKYGIKYSMTARTDRAIGYKSNAKKLTRKADATNTLFVASTSNSTDWYKFTVSSKRATRITINTAGIKSGSLTVTVYKGSTKIGTDTIPASYSGQKYDITYGTTYGKANAGTYYVKIVKGTKASGKYSIRYTY